MISKRKLLQLTAIGLLSFQAHMDAAMGQLIQVNKKLQDVLQKENKGLFARVTGRASNQEISGIVQANKDKLLLTEDKVSVSEKTGLLRKVDKTTTYTPIVDEKGTYSEMWLKTNDDGTTSVHHADDLKNVSDVQTKHKSLYTQNKENQSQLVDLRGKDVMGPEENKAETVEARAALDKVTTQMGFEKFENAGIKAGIASLFKSSHANEEGRLEQTKNSKQFAGEWLSDEDSVLQQQFKTDMKTITGAIKKVPHIEKDGKLIYADKKKTKNAQGVEKTEVVLYEFDAKTGVRRTLGDKSSGYSEYMVKLGSPLQRTLLGTDIKTADISAAISAAEKQKKQTFREKIQEQEARKASERSEDVTAIAKRETKVNDELKVLKSEVFSDLKKALKGYIDGNDLSENGMPDLNELLKSKSIKDEVLKKAVKLNERLLALTNQHADYNNLINERKTLTESYITAQNGNTVEAIAKAKTALDENARKLVSVEDSITGGPERRTAAVSEIVGNLKQWSFSSKKLPVKKLPQNLAHLDDIEKTLQGDSSYENIQLLKNDATATLSAKEKGADEKAQAQVTLDFLRLIEQKAALERDKSIITGVIWGKDDTGLKLAWNKVKDAWNNVKLIPGKRTPSTVKIESNIQAVITAENAYEKALKSFTKSKPTEREGQVLVGTENGRVKEANEALAKEVKELDDQKVQTDIQHKQAALDEAKNKKEKSVTDEQTSILTTIKTSQDELTSTEEALTKLSQDTTKLQEQKSQFEKELTAVTAKLNGSNPDFMTLSNQISKIANQLTTVNAQIEANTKNIALKKNNREELTKGQDKIKTDAEKRKKDALELVNHLTTELETLKSKLSSTSSERIKASITKSISEIEKEIKATQADVDRQQEIVSKFSIPSVPAAEAVLVQI